MSKRMYVTLDTEMDCDIRWGRPWPATFTSVTEGIPKVYRPIWKKYDVHPIYFVSPEVLYSAECCEILKNEVREGAQIGAHLHYEYIEPNKVWDERVESISSGFPCMALSMEEEYEKIKNLTNLISEKLDIRPIWYRAARFGVRSETYEILKKLGYKFDSSVTPGISWLSKGGPDYRKYKNIPYQITGDIKEYPITIEEKRWGLLGKCLPDNWFFYKWLRPTNMTCFELKNIIRKKSISNEDILMMFHSMEVMINKTPYVRSEWMRRYYIWRLDRSLGYAKEQGYLL